MRLNNVSHEFVGDSGATHNAITTKTIDFLRKRGHFTVTKCRPFSVYLASGQKIYVRSLLTNVRLTITNSKGQRVDIDGLTFQIIPGEIGPFLIGERTLSRVLKIRPMEQLISDAIDKIGNSTHECPPDTPSLTHRQICSIRSSDVAWTETAANAALRSQRQSDLSEPPDGYLYLPHTRSSIPEYEKERKEAIEKMIERLYKSTAPDWFKEKTEKLVWKFEHIFQTKITAQCEPSTLPPFRLELLDPENPPVRSHGRNYSAEQREFVDKYVDEMLECDLIYPTTSAWARPLHLVYKLDRETTKIRPTVDFRATNARSKHMQVPVPFYDSMLQGLAGSTCFAGHDFCKGFWNIAVHPDSQDKVAFLCHRGAFAMRRLAFGLKIRANGSICV